VVRRLVVDLHLPVEIVVYFTVREDDGLARSSRNAFLDPDQRRAAAVLFRALAAAQVTIEAGERDAGRVRALLAGLLATEPLGRVDYAEVVDAETFQPVDVIRGRVVLPIAVRFGATRLLDNLQLAVDGGR